MITKAEMILIAIGILLFGLVGAYIYGHHEGSVEVQAKWDAEKAQELKQVAVAQVKSDAITTKVETQYVDRIQYIHDKGKTIIQKVPVYVTPQADSRCTVNVGLVRLLDAAASSSSAAPASASTAYDAASGIELSAIGKSVADNYVNVCQANAEQLKELQDWERQQQSVK